MICLWEQSMEIPGNSKEAQVICRRWGATGEPREGIWRESKEDGHKHYKPQLQSECAHRG